MKSGTIVALLFFILMLNSCSQFGKQRADDRYREDQSLQQPAAETILNCLQNNWDLSRKEYKKAYKAAQEQYTAKQSEYNQLRLLCFNIHPSARYNQFREGIKQLSKYTKEHPKESSGLTGLKYLLELIDSERILRWNASNKNDDLLERNQQLQMETEQDKLRLKELKKQIDQLKNIESIIKNREY